MAVEVLSEQRLICIDMRKEVYRRQRALSQKELSEEANEEACRARDATAACLVIISQGCEFEAELERQR